MVGDEVFLWKTTWIINKVSVCDMVYIFCCSTKIEIIVIGSKLIRFFLTKSPSEITHKAVDNVSTPTVIRAIGVNGTAPTVHPPPKKTPASV